MEVIKKYNILNYRPIAILSTLGKIFERVMANRLCLFLENNKILTTKQYGFNKNRPTHAIVDFIITVVDSLTKIKYQ